MSKQLMFFSKLLGHQGTIAEKKKQKLPCDSVAAAPTSDKSLNQPEKWLVLGGNH